MKKQFKIISLCMAVVLLLGSFSGCSTKLTDKLYFENTLWGDSPEEVAAALGYDLSVFTPSDHNTWVLYDDVHLPDSKFTVSGICLGFSWEKDGSKRLSYVRLGFKDEKDSDAYRAFLCSYYGQPEETYGDADNRPDTLHEWWQYRTATPEGDRVLNLRHYASGHFLLDESDYAGIFLITPTGRDY